MHLIILLRINTGNSKGINRPAETFQLVRLSRRTSKMLLVRPGG